MAMKGLIAILGCLAIFGAGAVWALEGCRELGVQADATGHAEKLSPNHRHDEASHRSHSDPSKIHCPNVFGEFLVSSRVTLTSDHVSVRILAGELMKDFASDPISGGLGGGPAGWPHSRTLPRHLLLSVIRI